MPLNDVIHVEVEATFPTSVDPTPNVCQVALMFGLGLEPRDLAVLPKTAVPLTPSQVVFITGPSGGGKSTLLGALTRALSRRDTVRVIDFASLPDPPDVPLVDSFEGTPLEDVMADLSRAGLSDAFVWLRRPSELSDGQRYRYHVARAMHMLRRAEGQRRPPALNVVIADEFGATLDRTTATILARNVRRWVTRSDQPVCFVAATTHDDLLEPLQPDVLVVKDFGDQIDVYTRDTASRHEDKQCAGRSLPQTNECDS